MMINPTTIIITAHMHSNDQQKWSEIKTTRIPYIGNHLRRVVWVLGALWGWFRDDGGLGLIGIKMLLMMILMIWAIFGLGISFISIDFRYENDYSFMKDDCDELF